MFKTSRNWRQLLRRHLAAIKPRRSGSPDVRPAQRCHACRKASRPATAAEARRWRPGHEPRKPDVEPQPRSWRGKVSRKFDPTKELTQQSLTYVDALLQGRYLQPKILKKMSKLEFERREVGSFPT